VLLLLKYLLCKVMLQAWPHVVYSFQEEWHFVMNAYFHVLNAKVSENPD
jgi:hypothetical protein